MNSILRFISCAIFCLYSSCHIFGMSKDQTNDSDTHQNSSTTEKQEEQENGDEIVNKIAEKAVERFLSWGIEGGLRLGIRAFIGGAPVDDHTAPEKTKRPATKQEKELFTKRICDIAFGLEQQKTKISRFIEALEPDLLHQIRGFILGAGSVTSLWLLGHAFTHSLMEYLEPQTFSTAAPSAAVVLIICYMLQKAVKDRRSFTMKEYLILSALPILKLGSNYIFNSIVNQKEETKDKGE